MGAPGDDTVKATDAGSVRAYLRTGTAWTEQALKRRVSDRISVTSNYHGITARDFFIEGIRYQLNLDGTLDVVFQLSDAETWSDWFTWGVSKWGQTTRAPY